MIFRKKSCIGYLAIPARHAAIYMHAGYDTPTLIAVGKVA
jgi:hypothetical protein